MARTGGPTVGSLLRRYRLAANLTQEELAERAGISVRGLKYLEQGARRPFPSTVRRLAAALPLSPSEQATFAALAAHLPLAGDVTPAPTNLPAPLTSFIGRGQEIAALRRRLRPGPMQESHADVDTALDPCRLLTLTGPAGCGKTRLALRVADELLESYRDGVWLVELAALTDPALVPQAVVGALNLREQPGRALAVTLREQLRSRHLLLVMDNCEHLVGACAELATSVLQTCPAVRILATSREGLGVSGEALWEVPSLSLPAAGTVPPWEQLPAYDAVRMFVVRVGASQPAFALTEQNAADVVQICRQLDGMPLAMELAAARVRALSVAQLATRLDDRFRLLVGGTRTALPRHQTLQATMDWSYSLLSESERVLLRRVAVFAGGWTLEAAEATCAGEGIAAGKVLELLSGLVARSLVQATEVGGATRYRLLETVRLYGAERLVEAGEKAPTRDSHLACYLALAEGAEPQLQRPDQVRWLARLALEHDNLRLALSWALGEGGQVQAALRLAAALAWYWWKRGHIQEGLRWLEDALAVDARQHRAGQAAGTSEGCPGERGHPTPHRTPRTWALSRAGMLAWRQGEVVRATGLTEECLVLGRQTGDLQSTAFALCYLDYIVLGSGDLARAQALAEEALDLFGQAGDTWGIAAAHFVLHVVATARGDYDGAVALLEQPLAFARSIGGDPWVEADTLSALGLLASLQGEQAQASSCLQQGMVLSQALGDEANIALSLEGLALMAVEQGRAERGVQLFGAAAVLQARLGVPTLPVAPHAARHERALLAARAALGDDAFAMTWAAGQAMPLDEAITLALEAAAVD